MSTQTEKLNSIVSKNYEAGFYTDVEQDSLPPGLNIETIKAISRKKSEPNWLLDWRLDAYDKFKKMQEPQWAHVKYDPINIQDISYYAAPKSDDEKPKSLEEVDPKIIETYEKLGIPLEEQKMLAGVAVDVVFDSVSVHTTFKEKLAEAGVLFCSFSEAVLEYPEIVRKYLGSVVPFRDNYFTALNSAVFSDGSFAYIPENTKCPMELSTYFRINAMNTGQFERTLVVADKGCLLYTSPSPRDRG